MSNRITEFLDKNILFNYLIFNIITPPFSIQWIFEIKLRLNPKKSYLTNIHKVCRHALRYSIIITQFQILIKKMKRKFIVLSFMLSFLTFVSGGLTAQTDAYFSTSQGLRSPDAMGLTIEEFSGQFGHGFNFGPFSGQEGGFNFGSFDGQEGGFSFESFTGGDAPLANGLLIMTATGLIYLINKRRKENEK